MSWNISSILSLISHIHSQSQDFIQKEFKEMGLDTLATSHGNILFCLSQNQFLTPGELAKKINRDKSTATALVHKLEREGFVEIKKNSNDCRKKIITLTEKGKNYTEATDALSQKLLSTSWKNFSDEEKSLLLALLSKLSSNLEKSE